MFGQDWAALIAAFLIGTIAVARVARLVAEDEWPPVHWFRGRWISALNGTGWDVLVLCTFCIAPYVAAADLAWAIISDLQPAWWVVNGWLAAAYLAGMLTARDIPADQRQ